MIGRVVTLPIARVVSIGAYLDGWELGDILLPNRFLPPGSETGSEVEVFLYHDGEGRIIATTQRPEAQVGEVALLRVTSRNRQGAFLEWGLTKDLFLPLNQQVSRVTEGSYVLVYVYLDERTGRIAATEKISRYISNDPPLSMAVPDEVELIIWRQTDLGYAVIINNRHEGLLYFSDVFEDLRLGDRRKGFVKKIYPDGRIDAALGARGFGRVEEAHEKILRLLHEHNGYLPYYDKSDPEEIYAFFELSKKVFKAAVGVLYRERKITIEKAGIKLAESPAEG